MRNMEIRDCVGQRLWLLDIFFLLWNEVLYLEEEYEEETRYESFEEVCLESQEFKLCTVLERRINEMY